MDEINEFSFSDYENFGFNGLYGGLEVMDIYARKGKMPSRNILDAMGSLVESPLLFIASGLGHVSCLRKRWLKTRAGVYRQTLCFILARIGHVKCSAHSGCKLFQNFGGVL